MALKTAAVIQQDINDRFEKRIKDRIAPGSVIDMYSATISENLEEVYEEIEKNKTPHIWSNLEGEQLDWTGAWVNLPRAVGESDTNYRYRLTHWTKSNEAANTTAIQNATLSPQYASNIDYQPFTHGSGTGTCYIIPKEYTAETINAALNEAVEAIKKVASPSTYIEYIIPAIRSIKLEIYIESESGDLSIIKKNLESKIADYINAIAPRDYLRIGEINKMGQNESFVDYFAVAGVLVDNEPSATTRILQGIDTKMLFDEIIWIDGE